MERFSFHARENVSAWAGILQQVCPRCRTGKIFATSIFRIFPRMHERCPACGLKFEREPGYFLGAMYFSYAIGIVAISLFALIVWALFRWDLPESVGAGFLLFLPSAPVVTFFSRVLWIYFDQSIDPDWT
jgi:uncharacterized protein (DUF983 family)